MELALSRVRAVITGYHGRTRHFRQQSRAPRQRSDKWRWCCGPGARWQGLTDEFLVVSCCGSVFEATQRDVLSMSIVVRDLGASTLNPWCDMLPAEYQDSPSTNNTEHSSTPSCVPVQQASNNDHTMLVHRVLRMNRRVVNMLNSTAKTSWRRSITQVTKPVHEVKTNTNVHISSGQSFRCSDKPPR